MAINKLKEELFSNKEFVNLLLKIAGPLAPDIIKLFTVNDTYISEEISDKLNEKITNIRSTLNSLHYRGIACYKKTKNKDNNLFEFHWNIKFKKIIEIIIEQEMEQFNKIEQELKDKKDRDYFYCPNKCLEVPFEIAAAYNFKCPNCNNNLEIINRKNKIMSLKRKRTKIKKNIDELNNILDKIDENDKGYICE
jgi:transcription initiation factor TFIIE subunit alpha